MLKHKSTKTFNEQWPIHIINKAVQRETNNSARMIISRICMKRDKCDFSYWLVTTVFLIKPILDEEKKYFIYLPGNCYFSIFTVVCYQRFTKMK